MKSLSKAASRRSLVSAALGLAASLVGTTSFAGIVTTGGISVDFEQVGYPGGAARIAACSPTKIYALNTDHSLWVSYNHGADGSWQYLTTPGGADNIACDGPTLIAMNYDKSIWRYLGGSSWTEFATAYGANVLGGGPGVLTALNFDHSFWTSVGNDSTTFPGVSWSYRGTPGAAARVTGSISNGFGRFFALNNDGSLWLDDQVLSGGAPGWQYFGSGLPRGVVPQEISAAGTNEFFILDNTHHLWTAQVVNATLSGTKTGITTSQTGNVTSTVTLIMDEQGHVTFQPRTTNTFQESGYMYNIACALEDASGHAYTMQFAGHVNPAPFCLFCNDSSTDVPTSIGTVWNPAVASNWGAINRDWSPNLSTNMSCVLDAQETLTTGTIIGDIVAAVGLVAGIASDPVAGVIAVVGAVVTAGTSK